MGTVCQVIIVDDEVLVRQGIKHLLQWEQEGFVIAGEASNGQEALKLIEQVQPHIVITDIVMPQMDGVELTSIIKDRYPEIEVIVLSSFSEFNYVRDTFQKGVADYILKPKLEAEQLLKILKRTVQRIPSLHLVERDHLEQPNTRVLLDRLMSGYEVESNIDLFPYPSFRLFGAQLRYVRSLAAIKEQLLQRLQDIFDAFQDEMKIEVLPTEDDAVVLLLNSSDSIWEQMVPAIRALSNSVRLKDQPITWVLGDPFRELTQLQEQYHEHFNKLSSYRYFLPIDRRLIITHELPKLAPEQPNFNMNEFMETMQQRRFDEAIDMLLRYVDAAAQYYTLDVFAFKSLLGNVVFNIIIMLGRLEVNTKELEQQKYGYFRSINESTHVTEAVKLIREFTEQVREAINISRHTVANPNLALIMDYIHQHYMEPISLSDVASHFHFNPSYLSTFFSSHHDEGFNEYLNRVRVEKAADLLQSTDLAIADIGVQVGYADHSYFTKVFKKLKGVAPSQYRKTYFKQ